MRKEANSTDAAVAIHGGIFSAMDYSHCWL